MRDRPSSPPLDREILFRWRGGDALFALLALADAAEVDAADALDESLGKYEARIDESGDAGSGR